MHSRTLPSEQATPKGVPTTDSAALERETKSGSHTRHSDLTEMHDDANALPFGGIGLPVRVGVRVSE